MPSTFQHRLLRQVAASLQSFPANNIDGLRYSGVSSKGADTLLGLAAKGGFYRHTPSARQSIDNQIAQLEPHLEGLDWLHDRLADDTSRQTLVEVICYRLLGARSARIESVHDKYWQAAAIVNGPAITKAHTGRMQLLDGWLDDFDLSAHGWPVRLCAHKLNVLNTFLLEQYRFSAPGIDVQARPGDVVVDGGGCWGDTALYFAHQVGASGQVHTFEFSPANLVLMKANLDRNPELSPRIHLQQAAVWNRSDETLHFDEAGPGTRLGAGGLDATTLNIDDWAARTSVPAVNYIKLDIEGAEGQALEGARRVIQKHQPTLAVALYHSLADFTSLPRLIDEMAPGYRFHLGHYTIHSEETILFAVKP